MVEFSLLASAAFATPGIFHHQEPLQQQLGCGGLCRPPSKKSNGHFTRTACGSQASEDACARGAEAGGRRRNQRSKDLQALSSGYISRQDISRSGFPQFKSSELVDPWRYENFQSDYYQLSTPISTTSTPVLIDIQDGQFDSPLFSFGVAEHCVRQEKIHQFLMSGSSIVEGESLNISLLSDLTGWHTLTIDTCQNVTGLDDFSHYDVGNCDSQPSLIYPRMEFYTPKPVFDFIEGLSCTSRITATPDGRMLFMGTEAEIRELLSVVSEFYLTKNTKVGSKRQMVVPYFRRSGSGARASTRNVHAQAQVVAPVKRPEKLKPSPSKKDSRKAGKERDLHRRNYFHACESLLSIVSDKNRGKMAVHSLKKSGPEISDLLTQFSAGIAGTGLAVLFSVVWKITSGKVPFCAAKLLNTGFALGLVWLSVAVNTLRDTILCISKNSSKSKWTDDEIGRKVERSVNQIFFRAATLMAVLVLRFA